jgi:hypothetical protein
MGGGFILYSKDRENGKKSRGGSFTITNISIYVLPNPLTSTLDANSLHLVYYNL